MNTQVEEKDEGLQQGSTPEERFFGVNHEVNLDDGDDDGKVEIETGEEESKPAPAAAADDDGGQKDELGEEMEEYSERVQKRINKLTWQAKEADRRAKRLESERDEAFRATQSLYSQNQQYQHQKWCDQWRWPTLTFCAHGSDFLFHARDVTKDNSLGDVAFDQVRKETLLRWPWALRGLAQHIEGLPGSPVHHNSAAMTALPHPFSVIQPALQA